MSYISGVVLDDTGAAAGGRTVRAYRRDTGALLGSATSVASAVTGDTNFLSTVLLLHGNGTNGSTAIFDSSLNAKTVTAYGNARISTAQSKFGGSSLYFDGAGDYLVIESHADFAFGSGSFTIEFWIYVISASNSPAIYDGRPSSSNGAYPYISVNGDGSMLYYVNTNTVISAPASTLAFNGWHHIEVSRSGTSTKMFCDGTQAGSTWTDATNYIQSAVTIGRNVWTAAQDFNGYLSDLRITKGIARYTANFTPPTVAFPDVDLAAGGYYIPTSYTGECNVITLDDSGGTTYNDLILRTTPV